jgi:hypothetical protein
MRDQPDFSDEFQEALREDAVSDWWKRTERHECVSENHIGAEYDFYGGRVDIRTLISVIRGKDGFRIESILYSDSSIDRNSEYGYVSVFVADVRDMERDVAFTPQS